MLQVPRPVGTAAELIARLEQLEASCTGSGSRTMSEPADTAGCVATAASADAQAVDVRAAGRIAVQLFRCQRLFHAGGDAAVWDAEVTCIALEFCCMCRQVTIAASS